MLKYLTANISAKLTNKIKRLGKEKKNYKITTA